MGGGETPTKPSASFNDQAVDKKQDATSESTSAANLSKSDNEVPSDVLKCELKHLDKRYNDKGQKYIIERVTDDDEDDDDQPDYWSTYAFCHIQKYDKEGDFEGTTLHVNPYPMRKLLADVIGDYPGEPIEEAQVEISLPAYCLFFYRRELELEGTRRFSESKDDGSLKHLNLLLRWIDDEFIDELSAFNRMLNSESKAIGYEYLWTVFRPGAILYTEVLGQPRACRLTNFHYGGGGDEQSLRLNCNFVDFDGSAFGIRAMCLEVPKYPGNLRVTELNVIPLSYHPQASAVKELLGNRGRQFESYVGQQFRHYTGVAVRKARCGYERFNIDGRVMIDCKTHHRLMPNGAFSVNPLDRSDGASRRQRYLTKLNDGIAPAADVEKNFDALTDEERLLTNATVRGYSFTEKVFLEFFLPNLSPIEWNTACFDQLVLPSSTKRTVQALVHSRSKASAKPFDDIIKNKGRGLVLVLHGSPGVGKTLTAECVAEYVKRPLFMVSSGDLGTDSGTLDAQLTRTMDMCATWNAVLLIDEADVFLERRSLHDMHRNAMVSVFLRVLEYYSGILFLTTNRVETFDDAFKSRIHVPIRYDELDRTAREHVWREMLRRAGPAGARLAADAASVAVEELGGHALNGRQIKNVVKAALSLAEFEGKELELGLLRDVVQIQSQFEADLTTRTGK